MDITAEEDYARNARIYKGVQYVDVDTRLEATVTVSRELLEDMPAKDLMHYVTTRLNKAIDAAEANVIYAREVERCRVTQRTTST